MGRKKILESISKAGTIQRAFLVIAVFSAFFASVLTWDLVIYRGTAGEASEWTASFIAEYGTFGLLISLVGRLALFIMFWVGWVIVSQNKRKISQQRHFLNLSCVLAFSLMLFTGIFLDFMHDLLFFGCRSTILLPFLVDPLNIVITSLLLALFSLPIAYVKTFKTRT